MGRHASILFYEILQITVCIFTWAYCLPIGSNLSSSLERELTDVFPPKVPQLKNDWLDIHDLRPNEHRRYKLGVKPRDYESKFYGQGEVILSGKEYNANDVITSHLDEDIGRNLTISFNGEAFYNQSYYTFHYFEGNQSTFISKIDSAIQYLRLPPVWVGAAAGVFISAIVGLTVVAVRSGWIRRLKVFVRKRPLYTRINSSDLLPINKQNWKRVPDNTGKGRKQLFAVKDDATQFSIDSGSDSVSTSEDEELFNVSDLRKFENDLKSHHPLPIFKSKTSTPVKSKTKLATN